MAAIDKIYGSTKQYDEFKSWAEKNCPKWLKHFYPRDGYEDGYDRPITSLPEEADWWLLENCPIQFVTDRIKEQYDIT
jgi:hypothetical protein